MNWDYVATKLRDTAAEAVVVERAEVKPGPDFARDCRLIAVYLEQAQVVPLGDSEFARAACAWATQPVYRVVFFADCLPGSDDDGNPPDPAAVTAWSAAFLADAQTIHDALAELADSGDLAPACDVQIGTATSSGPLGGGAEISYPVTVLATS